MTEPAEVDYESLPGAETPDETDRSLRSYLAGLSGERLAEYDPSWSDERLTEWDGNFRSDGAFMLVCCERDVDVKEFRRELEAHLKLRKLHATL